MLKRLLPKGIRSYLHKLFREQHRVASQKATAKMNIQELHPKHISNLKALIDREALLKLLPTGAVVAEIGVDQGNFSAAIIEHTAPKELHLIDPWDSQRYHQGKQEAVRKKFTAAIDAGMVKIHQGRSTAMAKIFPDQFFDWIYIDTDHSYANTLEELILFKKKVKPSGIISGHDFIQGNWNGLVRYGVREAIYEFCTRYNWEIIYITMENQAHPSFAIRRIKA